MRHQGPLSRRNHRGQWTMFYMTARKERPRTKVLIRAFKARGTCQESKGQIPPLLAGKAGPHILLNHVKQPAFALPTPGPSYDIWVATPVTFLGECFIKIELPTLGLKLKRKIARIRSLF